MADALFAISGMANGLPLAELLLQVFLCPRSPLQALPVLRAEKDQGCLYFTHCAALEMACLVRQPQYGISALFAALTHQYL
jgi:hypothetical protein